MTGCIRVPAAFCGVFGFRPSHRAISTVGVLPVSQSLDSIGMYYFVFSRLLPQYLLCH